MKNFVIILNILVIFFTSILLSESYLSLQQVTASLVCKCNHSSHKEIHSTNSILLDEHSNLLNNNIPNVLPSCHSPAKEGVHICSCKKSSENLVHILFQKSVIIDNTINIFSICITEYQFIGITVNKVSLANGFNFLITPPPKPTI